MDTGISIYPGLGGSITEKTDRIDAASALGIRRLFTSFHIPETDASAFHKELDAVLIDGPQPRLRRRRRHIAGLGRSLGNGPFRTGKTCKPRHYDDSY